MRLKWPEIAKKEDSHDNYLDMKLLDVSSLSSLSFLIVTYIGNRII
jgi:hypothetical protein